MKPDRNQIFWMICRMPSGRHSKTQPKVRYEHRDAAWDDAARLARETGETYALLTVDEVVTPSARLTQGRLF
ncbi:hypothetical protein [Pseudooceanicola sp.]|uniref:hypothetical protein n=1 Tax=Pseudooceanicola sp. TaxID=1914328 RepID=UPI0035C714CB